MDTRIKQILGVNKIKESVNTDNYLNLQINECNQLLPSDEMIRVLDINKQFNSERDESPYYRIIGKINTLFSNVLFNITGEDSYETFNQNIFKINNNNNLTYGESIKKNLKEIDGWFGYFNPNKSKAGLCNYIDMEPKRERFTFIQDITNAMVKNWELTITYPYTADTKHHIINNGLTIIDMIEVIVGGKNMVGLSVPVYHNLAQGDMVTLTGTNKDGIYEVKRVGLDDGSLKRNYFCLDIDGLIIDIDSRVSKMYNGTISKYYFRKFKKIKTRESNKIESDDYEIYNLAFSENIFSDNITQFVFNSDIDISNLTDNLNRPLSELYLTLVKTSSENMFTNVSSGIEMPHIPFLNTSNVNQHLKNIPSIQRIHNVISSSVESSIPLELDVDIDMDDFYGDVAEYNNTTLEEVILSDVYHRFNTNNREIINSRPEGYYYKPHNLIKIRNFSSYIEQGDNNTSGMPSYTTDLGNGMFIWRDLLEIGTTDLIHGSLNYPFLNGCHYMYQNYNVNLRRQDPFDNWDLYSKNFPSDQIGNTINNNFKINSSPNVC